MIMPPSMLILSAPSARAAPPLSLKMSRLALMLSLLAADVYAPPPSLLPRYTLT